MMVKKRLPDWLTASRGIIGAAILGLIPLGPQVLPQVVALLLLGWTTDMLDGRLARRYEKEPTWIGDHDFQFDMFMVLASSVYLAATGYVPLWIAIPYLSVGTVISLWLYWTSDFIHFKGFTMAMAFPWVFAPFIIAYFYARTAAYAGLIWMVTALLIDWKRFTGVVGDFLEGTGLVRR